LNPSLALIVSIAGILILLRLKAHPGIAVLFGSLVLSLLVVPLGSIPNLMVGTLMDYQTLRLLVIIAAAMTLSSLMESRGLLTKLATVMESVGPKLAVHVIPSVIGLVPMPAGALVSATTLRDMIKRMGLAPEEITFINYWFRHVWEFSWPVYQAVIIVSVVLSVRLSSVVITLFPMTILAILFGALLSHKILKKRVSEGKRKASVSVASDLLKASWPIFLLVLLILVGLDAVVAFPLALTLLALQQRVRWPELKKALKYGLDPKILFLLYAIMLYKATIEGSGSAYSLFSDMQSIGVPAFVILITLPFLIAMATGLSIAYAGIAFPLLVPFIASNIGMDGPALILAYTSGMVGLLLSPLHLCLILSAEYFKAELTKVYRYILPPVIVIETIALAAYLMI
jgi:hypothetical protein